ncbi:MAG: sigma-54-dependent Fis family transcriptional regulator, partial [Candidatus Tectomicrobia bacterium]|nr:sigma-54-dependent Fis family transcriptional regulator [Candidatus Tectomicrobia bacterium]
MSDDIQILVIDDEAEMRRLLGKVLSKEGYAVQTSLSGTDALKRVERTPFDIVVTDLKMRGMDGIEVLRTIKRTSPETTVVLMTAFGSIDSAIQAMKEGAYHYITKPFKMEGLLILLRRALEERQLQREVLSLRQEVQGRYRFSNILGKSRAMQAVFELIRKVSASKSTVLLSGESGTG